jgi:hypothetical protein
MKMHPLRYRGFGVSRQRAYVLDFTNESSEWSRAVLLYCTVQYTRKYSPAVQHSTLLYISS